MTTKALGKGLSALISDSLDMKSADKNTPTTYLNVSKLIPSKFQPRKLFDENKLQELAQSIKEHGIIQPIIIQKSDDEGRFAIIAGERRWRAAKIAGLEDVPVIVHDLTDQQAIEFALIENIQRESLSTIEEAEGYKRLQEEFSYTQEQLAKEIGKSRSHIANMLRILQLPFAVKSMLNEDLISFGHARVLLSVENPEALAEKIVAEQLSVRQTERFAQGFGSKNASKKAAPHKTSPASEDKDDDIIAMEEAITSSTGLRVAIRDHDSGGTVTLHFTNLAELDTILTRLT